MRKIRRIRIAIATHLLDAYLPYAGRSRNGCNNLPTLRVLRRRDRESRDCSGCRSDGDCETRGVGSQDKDPWRSLDLTGNHRSDN